MRIVATADLHGAFPEIPECDLLLIAGDVCPVEGSHEVYEQRAWLRTVFSKWLEAVPAKEVVWIAGNHDFACEAPGFRRIADDMPGHYLIDSGVELEGLSIYGTPWTPNLRNWAFYAKDRKFELVADAIPVNTDILVLHSPPRGLQLDGGHPEWAAPFVASKLQTKPPRLCVFGHIHEGYGTRATGGVEWANVAYMDEDYNPVNPPMVFEWPSVTPH